MEFFSISAMDIFDSHCHLQDKRITPFLGQALNTAYAAGVRRYVCCGTSEADWTEVAALSGCHDGVIPAFGLHPWYVQQRTPAWLQTLTTMLNQHPAAGVGEIGLDYARKELDQKDQDAVLLSQLRLAAGLMRPVSIHCRQAWDALLRVLTAAGPLPRGFVIHSYSGSAEMIPTLVAIGAHFSFSGSITLSHNRRGRASAAAVPSDRLLIETDAPDIPPFIANTGRPDFNEPRHLVHVLETLAALRNLPCDVLADLTWRNACRFFLPA